jgi:hypothetical protein
MSVYLEIPFAAIDRSIWPCRAMASMIEEGNAR